MDTLLRTACDLAGGVVETEAQGADTHTCVAAGGPAELLDADSEEGGRSAPDEVAVAAMGA